MMWFLQRTNIASISLYKIPIYNYIIVIEMKK
jgi:hypothetical protein